MKLKFKHQKFQEDAAKAVCDVFGGQPYKIFDYQVETRKKDGQTSFEKFTGFRNHPIVPQLTDEIVLKHIRDIQRAQQIKPSEALEGKYNLTIEMETGVGKTYTYIKTIFELNKRYGWCKFIIVVPSVAIREGVHKSLEIMKEHFASDYSTPLSYFIYDSKQLGELNAFVTDSKIHVMIINSQKFNATNKDARRIYMKLDDFGGNCPIDVIAQMNPILIIDEPQSVEGAKTKEGLKRFNPLFTLRYSATHRELYNLVYRLDAMEAYNLQLVKKIAVKGISISGTTATEGFVYLEGLNLYPDKNPTANIGFEVKRTKAVNQVVRALKINDDLYAKSNHLEEYRNDYVITDINGVEDSVTFRNGIKLYAGDVAGSVNETQLRRIQIRETILSHIEKEQELFEKDIKVLSLFFIDEVAKYRRYNPDGKGEYAEIFEQEYTDIIKHLDLSLFNQPEYIDYLKSTVASKAHEGYFSKDKKGKLIDSKTERGTKESADEDAYDLIMKNKERLLDRKEPIRFIFSHSALREGWDNPNVFQICTLKQSSAEVRKRQEVGRGLRLCVNGQGDRMDANVLGEEVHRVNLLTVIASESYESFAKGLQTEMAEAIADRPQKVTIQLFKDQSLRLANGETIIATEDIAQSIYDSLLENKYIKKGELTDKFYEDRKQGEVIFDDELTDYKASIMTILASIYNPREMQPNDARKSKINLRLSKDKLENSKLQELLKLLCSKSTYTVKFDEKELVERAIESLNEKLRVSQLYLSVITGQMEKIKSKAALISGEAFKVDANQAHYEKIDVMANDQVKYDLLGKLTDATNLTRQAVAQILSRIKPNVFGQFKNNPEDFIIKASELINEEKVCLIVKHIEYTPIDQYYDVSVFTRATIQGRLGVNTIKADKHLYDHVRFDSQNEKTFMERLEENDEIEAYVKLPDNFYIPTPMGKYHPDWAIVFKQKLSKYPYFIAETKASDSSLQDRRIEEAKIECAKKHFAKTNGGKLKYNKVSSFEELLKIVTQESV